MRARTVAVIAILSLCSGLAIGEEAVKYPSAEDAITTCLTLQRLLAVASHAKEARDAAVLHRAFIIARQYVTDQSSIAGANQYISAFEAGNPRLLTVQIEQPGVFTNKPGFTNVTINDAIASLSTDSAHKSAVIVVGRDDAIHFMHSTLDPAAMTTALAKQGLIARQP